MYKTVYDLTLDELSELKTAYFYNPENDDTIPDYICFPEAIPNDIIYNNYDGIIFTTDDFFCNTHLPF